MGAEIPDSYPSSTLDPDLMLWFKSVLSQQPGLAGEAPHTTSPIPVFVNDLSGPWTEVDHSGMSASTSDGPARRRTHAKTHTERRGNPIQWHRSCLGVRRTALSRHPPWPCSSFLSTFFQVFGQDLFSLSALFKDLLYAGSPPDAVLQSPHCLSFFSPTVF